MKASFLSVFLAILILVTVSACKKKPPEPTYTPEADFAAIDISNPGIQDLSIQVSESVTWNFRIIVPAASGDRPMILALHGASGGDPDAHKTTACLIEPGLASLDAFIIHPNGGSKLWDHVDNQQMLASLTLWATDYWPIDEDKIAVTGYSNGGNGSWYLGETQPQFFSAAIPMASSYNTYRPDSTVRVMPVPMYVIHGEDDTLFPLAETQGWVDATKAAGSDITFVVADSLGHYVPCEYVPYLQDAADWLENVVW